MKKEKTEKLEKTDKTHISIILDRTGSMESIKDDTIGGFNAFLREQKAQPGEATLTLVQFDSQDPYEVIHSMKPIAKITELDDKTYVPRATTPLLDAIGRGINDLGKQLADMKKKDRPGKIVLVVITDGQENASEEFSKKDIVKMIKKKEEKGWQFVFLSADLASIDDAAGYGFKGKSSMKFRKDGKGTSQMLFCLSDSVSNYRSGKCANVEFSEKDRKKQEEDSGIKID